MTSKLSPPLTTAICIAYLSNYDLESFIKNVLTHGGVEPSVIRKDNRLQGLYLYDDPIITASEIVCDLLKHDKIFARDVLTVLEEYENYFLNDVE